MDEYKLDNITTIILTKNEEKNIIWVVNELKKFNLNKILVADAGSTDGTIKLLKEKNINYFIQKEKGYGGAILEAVNKVDTDYLTIIDADGSYNSNDIPLMYNTLINKNLDLILGSRYKDGNKSADDTIIRLIGNKFFTKLCCILFNLEITDCLFHFPVCKTITYKNLNLKFRDFSICFEMPVKAKFYNFSFEEYLSLERPRMHGESKVNAFTDGLKILFRIIKLFIELSLSKQKIKS